jgi:multidrug efflux pump subunit AcrB
MVERVEELNDIPIRTEPGNAVYLQDIGRAEDSHSIQTALVRINGHRQVYVPIYRQQGASSLTVVGGVKNAIPKMEERLPQGVKLDLVMDQSVYVREAINGLIHEGIIGAVLVAIMILIFLGNWRMTVIAGMSIPLAILCAIIGIFVTGNTINAMTLGGLALAIGPLVDNAIVVLENTHRHSTPDKGPLKAAFDGAIEVTLPVLVATLTTIIVLCPIALMPGMGGFLFRPMTLALAFAMIASFILSQTLVPTLCANWLVKANHSQSNDRYPRWAGRFNHRFELALHFLTFHYQRLLAHALNHRALVLASVGFLFLISVALIVGIGQEFFPQVDAGQVTVHARVPSGTNIEATEKRIIQLEKFLERNIPARERKMIISELGLVPDWSAAYTPNSGSQDAIIKVQFTDERALSAQEYAVKLRHLLREDARFKDLFSDLRVSFDTGGMVSAALNYGASSPIDVQIEGGALEQGLDLAQKIRRRVSDIPGTADVRIQQRLDAPQRKVVVDRQKAADLGLSEYDVVSQVATAINSSVGVNRNFWIDNTSGNQYFVAVQYPEEPNLKMEDILNIVVTGAKQSYPVKLSSLVHIESGAAPVEVNHISLARVFNVLVNTEGRDIGSVARDIQNNLRGLDIPSGMRINLRGEYSRMIKSFGNLGFGLLMAAMLVYLLLVALFRSYLGPFIIMFAVPLGLIGVLWMLFLTRTTLNVQSSMGVIFMVGIVVANSVLLVDFANQQRKLGANIHQAITVAASIRFRPILMTFLATFLDLIPMAVGLGRGSEANAPLARAVVGGLLTSTFLTLIVVPILYTLLNRENRDPELDIDKELENPQESLANGAIRDGNHREPRLGPELIR